MIAKTMTFYVIGEVIGEERAYGLTCVNSSGKEENLERGNGRSD
jgi:hypothetical protein